MTNLTHDGIYNPYEEHTRFASLIYYIVAVSHISTGIIRKLIPIYLNMQMIYMLLRKSPRALHRVNVIMKGLID